LARRGLDETSAARSGRWGRLVTHQSVGCEQPPSWIAINLLALIKSAGHIRQICAGRQVQQFLVSTHPIDRPTTTAN